MAGIHLKMDPKWHTYWKNSGDSGMATEVKWELPPGFTAGEIQWPLPQRHADQDLVTYVYYGEAMLLVPITISKEAALGPKKIKASLAWLECEVLCVPGSAEVQAAIEVSSEHSPSPGATAIQKWKQHLPRSGDQLDLSISALKTTGNSRELLLRWKGAPGHAEFFPYPSPDYEVHSNPNPAGGELKLTLKKVGEKWPTEVTGVLAVGQEAQRNGYEIRVSSDPGNLSASGGAGTSISGQSLWRMLLYAFIGGLILNIMPCVLPVIALKILGFVGQARDHPARVRLMGLVYAAGVLVSFMVLAAIVIGVKAAGHQAGWGMQFGNPLFLVLLTILLTLVALNLFGLFEITPGAKVMDAAGSLSSKHGSSGAFFNGVLATILATPCTAPFLGVALGFAFAQPTPIIILVFAVVAAGLAAPYVLLSWNPKWLRFIPKPGPWMERFKIAMGFPMMATAVWLFSLTQIHYGPRSWWLALFLVFLALAAWIYGEFVQRRVHRLFGYIAVLVVIGAGYVYAVESQLRWRSPLQEDSNAQPASQGLILWQKWSPDAVQKARSEGRPVLVDFTADWCITCQANKKIAIEIPSVAAKLKEINAVALLGDYTRLPADITTELQRFGRAGVPLVLVYPRDPQQPPKVLPEALTSSIMLNALEQAGK